MVSEEVPTAPVLGWGSSFVQGMRANTNLVIHYVFFSADCAPTHPQVILGQVPE